MDSRGGGRKRLSARLLPFLPRSPAENMAVDEALLLEGPVPTLRFYGWAPPAISLGWFQRDPEELAALRSLGLPCVRRMTGGGAIVHWHELTYSLCLEEEDPLLRGSSARESYAILHDPLLRGLGALGVPVAAREGGAEAASSAPLCFHRRSSLDLVAEGRKLVGSAQRRTRGRVLQHGSIILAGNPHQSDTASLADFLGTAPAPATLAEALVSAFEDLLGPLRPGGLEAREEARVRERRSVFEVH